MSQNGPLIDLVSRGEQDNKIITNDINKSFFKESVIEHTNFSKGSITVNFKGSGNWGSTIKFTIPKDGDLLSSLYLNVRLPDISIDDIVDIPKSEKKNYLVKWTDYIGNALIDKVTLKIGGQIIDEQYGIYMQINTDLYDNDWNKLKMLGHDQCLNLPQENITNEELFIPLKFWFSNNLSKALPLVAIQYHDIELEVKFSNFHNMYSILKKLDNGELIHTCKQLKIKQLEHITLETNIIYLSNEERKKIATSEHEILITQVQRRQNSISTDNFIELDFNHPIKELIFIIQPLINIKQGEYFNFTSKLNYLSNEYENIKSYDYKFYKNLPKYHLLDKARILFNGKERISWKNYKYYYYLQNYEHYKNATKHYIYLYSFSLKPLSYQPTGSCNFSRIDNAQLQFKLKNISNINIPITNINNTPSSISINNNIRGSNPANFTVYTTNYNYLVIKNGMAGLKFNN